MSRRPPARSRKAGSRKAGPGRRLAELEAEVDRLRRELEEARAALRRAEEEGLHPPTDEVLARRIAALREGQQVARGQAVEAALARSRAEAALNALRDSIVAVPGLRGWLLRKLARGGVAG